MKRAKLYQVTEVDVMATNYVEVAEMKAPPRIDYLRVTNGDLLAPLDINRISIPVELISHIENGKRKDEYLAIHPKLRNMIEILKEAELQTANYRIKKAVEEKLKAQDDVKRFFILPWYKRVYIALRGKHV